MKRLVLSGVSALALLGASCTPAQVSTATTATADAATMISDLIAAEQQIQSACQNVSIATAPPCATAALTSLATAIASAQKDLAALSPGSTGAQNTLSTVLSDIQKAVVLIAQYAPMVLSLVGVFAETTPPQVPPGVVFVRSDTLAEMAVHFKVLKSHVAAAN